MRSILCIACFLPLLVGMALSAEQDGDVMLEGVYENPKEGPPASYAIYKSEGKVTKVVVGPDLSSHLLTVTGFYSKDGDLILFTVEMWDLLDAQAERLKDPKFNSITVYQVKDGKITQRSSDVENRYFESKRIPNYLKKVIESSSK